MIKELENTRRRWGEVKLIANNRVRWKAMVEALCLFRAKRFKSVNFYFSFVFNVFVN